MGIKSLIPKAYYPTAPRSGGEGEQIFRMQNMVLLGDDPDVYAEVISPPLDLAESFTATNVATGQLTGTLACTINNRVIVGTGTAFLTELHIGQTVVAKGGAPSISIPLIVDFITDNTHFTATRAPQASSTGCTGVRMRRLFDVGKKRGTLFSGNGVEFDLGTILCVGSGELRLNGAALPGVSLTATRAPQIALLNSGTGNYTVFTLGMTTPTGLTAAETAGPSANPKNMQAAVYSIRAVRARQATNGYNNPSNKAEVTITVAGNFITGTFPAADTTNGQDAWIIYASLFTQSGGINGPWFRYEPNEGVPWVAVGAGAGEIAAAGGTYDIEYNDAELGGNDLLSFDNDAPPDAEFVGVLSGTNVPTIPMWLSCQGPGATSPGPFVVASKSNNIEAAPLGLAVSTSLPDTIIGFTIAQGRIYLLCVNTLQIGQATQTVDSRVPPVAIRPFWKAGFKNPDALIFIDGYLVGFTNHGLARSLADGDEGSEEFAFAVPMDEFFRQLNPGHVKLGLDVQNNAVVVFHCGDSLNASGFWTTRCWMFSLRTGKWIGDIVLTSTTGDMIVSGVANINGQLEFLAGGVQADTSFVTRSYRWNAGSGIAVPWYLAWGFSDDGAENRPLCINAIRPTGLFSGSPTAGVFIVEPAAAVPVTALETGNSGSASGSIPLPTSTNVTQYDRIELNVSNAMQHAVRLDGTWIGTGNKDRVDECVVEAMVEGSRR